MEEEYESKKEYLLEGCPEEEKIKIKKIVKEETGVGNPLLLDLLGIVRLDNEKGLDNQNYITRITTIVSYYNKNLRRLYNPDRKKADCGRIHDNRSYIQQIQEELQYRGDEGKALRGKIEQIIQINKIQELAGKQLKEIMEDKQNGIQSKLRN